MKKHLEVIIILGLGVMAFAILFFHMLAHVPMTFIN